MNYFILKLELSCLSECIVSGCTVCSKIINKALAKKSKNPGKYCLCLDTTPTSEPSLEPTYPVPESLPTSSLSFASTDWVSAPPVEAFEEFTEVTGPVEPMGAQESHHEAAPTEEPAPHEPDNPSSRAAESDMTPCVPPEASPSYQPAPYDILDLPSDPLIADEESHAPKDTVVGTEKVGDGKPDGVSPEPAIVESELIKEIDGETILMSLDGENIRVDSVLFERASPVLASLFEDAEMRGEDGPVHIPEPTVVIRDIIQCLYPSSSRPLVKLSDPDHAVRLLLAMKTYQISSWVLEDVAARVVGAVDPPIRAWALAVHSGNDMARKIATRRFFSDASTGLEGDIRDLKAVDAWQLVRVVQMKAQTVDDGRAALSRIISASFSPNCSSTHRNHPGLVKAQALPFQFDLLPAATLTFLHERQSSTWCQYCSPYYSQTTSLGDRTNARRDLEGVLERAVDKECSEAS